MKIIAVFPLFLLVCGFLLLSGCSSLETAAPLGRNHTDWGSEGLNLIDNRFDQQVSVSRYCPEYTKDYTPTYLRFSTAYLKSKPEYHVHLQYGEDGEIYLITINKGGRELALGIDTKALVLKHQYFGLEDDKERTLWTYDEKGQKTGASTLRMHKVSAD